MEHFLSRPKEFGPRLEKKDLTKGTYLIGYLHRRNYLNALYSTLYSQRRGGIGMSSHDKQQKLLQFLDKMYFGSTVELGCGTLFTVKYSRNEMWAIPSIKREWVNLFKKEYKKMKDHKHTFVVTPIKSQLFNLNSKYMDKSFVAEQYMLDCAKALQTKEKELKRGNHYISSSPKKKLQLATAVLEGTFNIYSRQVPLHTTENLVLGQRSMGMGQYLKVMHNSLGSELIPITIHRIYNTPINLNRYLQQNGGRVDDPIRAKLYALATSKLILGVAPLNLSVTLDTTIEKPRATVVEWSGEQFRMLFPIEVLGVQPFKGIGWNNLIYYKAVPEKEMLYPELEKIVTAASNNQPWFPELNPHTVVFNDI